MNVGSFMRGGGGTAVQLLLRRSPSTAYIRPDLLSSKIKCSISSSLLSPASRLLSTTTTTVAASASTRNGIIGWYLGMIHARPILTKSLTAGAIFTAADISSQMITLKPSDSLDLIRTLRMTGYGMLLSGPSLHLWFNFVSRIIPKRDILSTMKKILIGQTVYGPIMTAIFFSVNAGLQGETGAEIVARLKRDMVPTLINGLIYWPMCDFVTLKFIPVSLQPLVSNSFSFLWSIYITYMANLQKASIQKIATN